MHQSDQWKEIERHLPDPVTASAETLEQQGDILRARRFPEDAMDYYRYALARGGNLPSIMNKLGLTELEMRNIELARSYFQRVVKLDRKYAEAWNNLGAVEFLDGQPMAAISRYKRAIKLEKREAVYHSNLATAYIGSKDYSGARREIAAALELDPRVFDRDIGFGGVAAHVLSSQDRARFSFEMARMYARGGMQDQMLHSLSVASEAGMDVQREMRKDPALARFEFDPRVVVLVRNAQELRAGHRATASASSDADAPGAGTKPL
jgi:tetratricopeptide (TPR) repeat protein